MASWSGWVGDILKAIGAPNTGECRAFLQDWQTQQPSTCKNNPLLASVAGPGTTSCRRLSGGKVAKNYTSPAQGTARTRAQMLSGSYPRLVQALRSGHPYHNTAAQAAAIVKELEAWGVPIFAGFFNVQSGLTAGGGGGGGGDLPSGHKGFNDFQHALAHHVPTLLRRSRAIQRHALKKLGAPTRLGG